jgi:hypothetical protein
MKFLPGISFLLLVTILPEFSSGQEKLSDSNFTLTVEHKFDQGGNASTMSLGRMLLASPDEQGESMNLLSMLTFDDQSKYILLAYLSFYSNAKTCRFPSTPEVELNLDGEDILIKSPFLSKELGPKEIKKGIAMSFNDPENGKCNESLELLLPHDLFLRVAGTKKRILVRTGKIQFALEGRALLALNEMAKRLKAPEMPRPSKVLKKNL